MEQMPTESILDRMRPSQKFFLLFGMFGVCYTLANVIGVLCIWLIADQSIFQMAQMDYSNPKVLLATQVGQVLGAIVMFFTPPLVFARLSGKPKGEYLSLNKKVKISTLILAGALMICAIPLINYMSALNSHMPISDFMRQLQNAADKEQAAFLKDQSITNLLVNIFMIGVLAAVGEELFFRAVLQKVFVEMTRNIHLGVLLTGIFFSLVHFEMLGFFPRMFMGMYLGYLFVWTKSIWVPMIVHFINNGLDVFLAFLEDRKIVPQKIDEIGSDKSQIGYVMISTVLVVVLLFIIYRIENKKTEVTRV